MASVNEVDDSKVARGYGAGLDNTLTVEGQPELTHYKVATRTATDHDVRCQGTITLRGVERLCNKKLAEYVGRPWLLICPRCHNPNRNPT